jgi:hypothetical protein
MRMYFAILAAFLFAATSLASPVSAQSVPKPADQAQPSTRSDVGSDADEAGADDSGAQLDSFRQKIRDPHLETQLCTRECLRLYSWSPLPAEPLHAEL